jgi:N-formylglutamate amidohydrolase
MIKENTLLSTDLYKDVFKESLIFHIPHSSYVIPSEYFSDYTSIDTVVSENNKLVDHATDEIFNISNTKKLIFEYSRIFCDVERLNDINEPMYKYGRGICYIKTDDGNKLRDLSNKTKKDIYNNFYSHHHNKLIDMVDENLNKLGFTTIIDCHSFADEPFKTDLIKEPNRPDFCLGIDKFHTPKWLLDLVFNKLKSYNYSIEINNPYEGTIVPLNHYKKTENVFSIMIEVNRKLYMDNGVVDKIKVKNLNNVLNEIFEL